MSTREVAVSLPDRRYGRAGRLPAQAVEESGRTGEPVRDVLHRKAEELGSHLGGQSEDTGLVDLLERDGFEPRREGDTIGLANCPFHAPAHEQAWGRDRLRGLSRAPGRALLRAAPAGRLIPAV